MCLLQHFNDVTNINTNNIASKLKRSEKGVDLNYQIHVKFCFVKNVYAYFLSP
jgi:hypothetical protein